MILNNRICQFLILFPLSAFVLIGLSSCGKINQSRLKNANLHSLIAAAQLNLDKNEESSLPDPDAPPVLKYTAISSIFPNANDITSTSDVAGTLAKLRNISSATNEFQAELYNLVNEVRELDSLHLQLISDASYFPNISAEKMKFFLSDINACKTLSPIKCNEKINQVNSNLQLAIKLGNQLNQTLIIGIKKIVQLDTNQAFSLLYRIYPETESSDQIFSSTFAFVRKLNSDEKLAFLELAIQKLALKNANQLAIDWFIQDSDKSSETLIALVSRFPEGDLRDQLILNLIVSVADFSNSDLSKLLSLCSADEVKDLLVNQSANKLTSVSSLDAMDLIRLSKNNKPEITQILINKINNFSANDLLNIAQNATYSTDREKIIFANINRFEHLSVNEARAIADLSGTIATDIVIALLPKINDLDGSGLTYIVQSIISGPGRDKALLAGIPNITSSNVSADIAGLNLAYNSKLQVTSAMLAKTKNLSSSDVAQIAKNCLSNSVRDQLLINGTNLISITTLEGVIAVIGLSTAEKTTLVLMNIAKIPNVSTNDFGQILKTIADGPTRDAIIDSGLGHIKSFSSEGAALIVDRSFESKVQTATKLISLIPNPTGTDLDKMLAVCGSGNTRDLILANGIKLLNKLTKAEAKSLYTRAYDDKEHVAILLMSKVDDIDGTTVGEIAMFSNKGTTRDLIITEGLKRLKVLDTIGLISMLKASYKTTETLLMEATSRIENFGGSDAIAIANAITDFSLKDRFLVHSIDLIQTLDESTITQLALKASTQPAREEIVQKGIDKLGGAQ